MPWYKLNLDGTILDYRIAQTEDFIELPLHYGVTPSWDGEKWIDLGLTLDKKIAVSCKKIDGTLNSLLDKGFIYNQITYQMDAIAQQNASGFLGIIQSGIDVFPIYWRTEENETTKFESYEDFKNFVAVMLGSIQAVYQKIWAAKDLIRASTSAEIIDSIVANYMEEI